MRPWMKMLAIGGVMGVALGVSLAGEKPTDRRAAAPAKSRTGRLEFISRGGHTGEQSDAPVDPTADILAEELAAEVSAAPKRFTRSKAEHSEDAVSPSSTRATLKPVKTANAGTLSELRPSTRTGRTTAKPQTDHVELLSPPESEATDEAPITRKLVARKINSGIQPIGDNARSMPAPKTELAPATAEMSDEEESADGVITAVFQRNPVVKDAIQTTSAEQHQVTPNAARQTAVELTPAAKTSRVSIVNDRSPKPMPAAAARSARSAASMDRTSFSKNSSTAGAPSVSVEWVKHGEINVGQECACELVVRNSAKVSARDVVVEAIFPPSVRLTQAKPEPEVVADHLEWSIPELAGGEERTIHITMIPSQRGELATTASIRFTRTAASVFKVAEPLLKVSTQAPAEVIVGDPLVQTVTITNPGTGVAQNVKIQVVTPEGLEATRGDHSTIEIGALNPGESRTVRLSFTAIAGGEQTLEVEATADSGLSQVADATINVIAPALAIAVEGPSLRYAGRDARFTLNITNEGKAATNNVRVTHRIPKGFKFVKADKGGTFDANTGCVNWFVGHLEPSQSAQVKLNLQATEIGQFEHHVSATAEHGVTAKADTTTKVEGSASLILEIQDLDDPVEVGVETAYEVRISNTGSKAAQNVGLTFELPSGVELLNVQSATQHLAKNGLILFNDLPELAPGKTALFRIHVKGEAEGNQRVRARLTSESIEQELITEELTKFYAE